MPLVGEAWQNYFRIADNTCVETLAFAAIQTFVPYYGHRKLRLGEYGERSCEEKSHLEEETRSCSFGLEDSEQMALADHGALVLGSSR
jgi:hypothetical protein